MENKTWQKYHFPSGKHPVMAIQWTGDNLEEVIRVLGMHESLKDMPIDEYKELVKRKGLKVFICNDFFFVKLGYFITCSTDADDKSVGVFSAAVFNDFFVQLEE